ncbi:hypothetical protein PIB30_007417 [Stylosanthes scabra]|uniref:Cell morphogenesis protein N-terminal domain-containing protein n=2 Tax=Stylosanthes scabra TaxID=79078 RepID=A0ABU6Q4M5_9FABA|nr:hypothetical protein [Stylosanthes scabra]
MEELLWIVTADESESSKGANDASTFQRKLVVECIFCSACIRFVECCPQEGLTEKLWSGLESFAFDWLNADRIIEEEKGKGSCLFKW